ncbi:hypothetical protein HPP92_007990 [Vanilla planifolia]|uniref:Uncharacterized protein n=1 Tax=Vanilla planifolia TaxID=51239 RepID=A0A835RS99_VANPL|nr:hypothetical protein HPP92_007990 [Vanilla planifolia]
MPAKRGQRWGWMKWKRQEESTIIQLAYYSTFKEEVLQREQGKKDELHLQHV